MHFACRRLLTRRRSLSPAAFLDPCCSSWLHCSSALSTAASGRNKYSHTIFLPKSKFPIHLNKAKRVELESKIAQNLNYSQGLYDWQLTERSAPRGTYIIHDGPPYANGPVHVGHAVNKILKDITVRYRSMTGYRVHYRPGWDCHGLPIELKATSSEEANSMSPSEIRLKAKQFALSAIADQQRSFQRWGVLGDWADPYLTFDPEYEAEQIVVFWEMYQRGFVYRDYKPVYWSPSSRTALAEAELEYRSDHVSKAAFIKFPIIDGGQLILPTGYSCNALIWTTTPWTIPMNNCIAFGPHLRYCWVANRAKPRELFLVCCDALAGGTPLAQLCEWSIVGDAFEGSTLSGIIYACPSFDNNSCSTGSSLQDLSLREFLPSRTVSNRMGTGLVHSAFAHGQDDYALAMTHGRRLINHVDDEGKFIDDFDYRLAGKDVLKEGSHVVLDILGDRVLDVQDWIHTYPYDWRTNQPVIVKASRQWFISVDGLKENALQEVDKVQFFPPNSKNGMLAQVKTKPAWCISRQRVWGLPIPVYYRVSSGEPIISQKFIDHLVGLVRSHGSEIWWTASDDVIFPQHLREPLEVGRDDAMLRRGKDIMDIWLDSGVSWRCAFQGDHRNYINKGTVDVVIEGLDQFRGWFSSLLYTGLALESRVPYKHVVVHGIVQDESGQKMSKSIGNVIDPSEITDGEKTSKSKLPILGADGLRLWVAMFGSGETNISLGPGVVEGLGEAMKNIRNCLKFILGSIRADQKHLTVVNVYDDLTIIDRYTLVELKTLINEVEQMYEGFDYQSAVRLILRFISDVLSARYFTAVKDRLYCDSAESPRRQSAEKCLYIIGHALARLLAPILPFLSEEYYGHCPGLLGKSCFEEGWPADFLTEERPVNIAVVEAFERTLQPLRKQFLSVHALDTDPMKTVPQLVIYSHGGQMLMDLKILQSEPTSINSELCDWLRVSCVTVKERLGGGDVGTETRRDNFLFAVKDSEMRYCERCRRFCVEDKSFDLCKRCFDVVRLLGNDS